jgi:hypothetical protein
MKDSQAITDLIRALIGKSPWGLRRGVGTFLTMEFGAPENDSSGKVVHGEWHLWLYNCNWRIEARDTVLVSSEYESTTIDLALPRLELDSIRQAEVSNPSLNLSLHFSSGVRLLTISSSAGHDQEQWMLFMPDGNCLTTFGDGSFEIKDRNEPRPRVG